MENKQLINLTTILPNLKVPKLNAGYDKIFNDFNCILFDEKIFFDKTVFQDITTQRIIVINTYQDIQCNYLIVCFEKQIVFVDIKKIDLFFSFLKTSANIDVISLSKNATELLKNHITQNDLINIIYFNQINFFKEEITEFIKYIYNIYYKSQYPFFHEILRSIAAYLIRRAYLKSIDFDRIKYYFQNTSEKHISLTNSDFIFLRNLQNGSSTFFVKLYYNISERKLFVFKASEKKLFYEREKSNYLQIQYPFIAKFYGTIIIDEYDCLVLEYIHGWQLLIVDQNIFKSAKDVFKIIFQMMISFNYLHKMFVIRDIHRNNFIITKRLMLILFDFNRMLQIGQIEPDSIDHDYLAPETQYYKEFSFEADIFSMGKIILATFQDFNWNNLDNQNLFDHDQFNKFFKECINDNPKLRPGLNELIKNFYINFLSKFSNLSETDIFQSNVNITEDIYQNYLICVSEPDNQYSLYQLAKIFDEGSVFKRDIKKAIKYYSLAADQNNEEARISLENILNEVKENKENSFGNVYNFKSEDSSTIDLIQNESLRNLYLKFNFLNFPSKLDLVEFIKDYKLMAYDRSDLNSKVVISVEDLCLIIDSNIFDNSFSSICQLSDLALIKNDKEVTEEVNKFCEYFQDEINNNHFVRLTIRALATFIIKRFNYPYSTFKNISFFSFDNDSQLYEYKNKCNLIKIFKFDKDEDFKLGLKAFFPSTIINKKGYDVKHKNKVYDFKMTDFILLKRLHNGTKATYYLAIHIKTFYIFMIKLFSNIKVHQDEIDFCQNYSYEYLTQFYGFVKDDGKIMGFVYEYMSNGSLKNLVSNHPDKLNNKFFSITTIVRIFECINYFKAKSLHNQTIKLTNIYLDHNSVPFISYSNPIPNNIEKEHLAFNSNIFSYGLIIYYIYEKEELMNENNQQSLISQIQNGIIPSISNCSSNIKELFHLCMRLDHNLDSKIMENLTDSIFKELTYSHFFSNYIMTRDEMKEYENSNNEKVKDDKPKEKKCNNEIIKDDKSKDKKGNNEILKDDKPKDKKCNNEIIKDDKQKDEYKKVNNKKVKDEMSKDEIINISYELINFVASLGRIDQLSLLNLSFFFNIFTINLKTKNDIAEIFYQRGFMYETNYGVVSNFHEAKKCYEYSIKISNPKNSKALLHLGIMYEKGFGVPKDLTKSLHYYNESASLNNIYAFYQLGIFYELGVAIERNETRAKEYFLKYGENNPDFMYQLGYQYEKGNEFQRNYKKAREYYELAAEKDHLQSIYRLGIIYLHGYDVNKDPIKAKDYFQRAIDLKYSEASYYLGHLYEKGIEFDKNDGLAIKYYKISADLNNTSAYLHLCKLLYRKYRDNDKIIQEAKEYFLQYAYNKSKDLLNIGLILVNGYGIKKDYSSAILFYKLALQLKNSDAYLLLGYMYESGCGVSVNHGEADKCFKKYENTEYLSELLYNKPKYANQYYKNTDEYISELIKNKSNDLYELGRFFQKCQEFGNTDLSISFYELASKFDHPKASVQLGIFYQNGINVVQDIFRAEQYFIIAANNKSSSALLNLGIINENKGSYSEAMKYYQLSADQKNSCALIQIGKMYEKGLGETKNIKKAMKQYEKSALLGNSEGFLLLGDLYYEKHDYTNAIKNYIESSKRQNSEASMKLGIIYQILKRDKQKSIHYFLRCINIEKNNNNNNTKNSPFYYRSNNEVGLIYIIEEQNVNLAENYLQESCINEYPIGQNSFGLFLLFYSKNINKREKARGYFAKASSEYNLPLCDYNLGHLYEEENNTKKAIECYMKASENENIKIEYRTKRIKDELFQDSQSFVICFVNFKLVKYFLEENDHACAKKFYIRAILNKHFLSQSNNFNFIFSPLKQFLFKLYSETELQTKDNHKSSKINKMLTKWNASSNQNCYPNQINLIDVINCLFDKISNNKKYMEQFLNTITKIIERINEILYQPPYSILFGRMNYNEKSNTPDNRKDMSQSFYNALNNS